MEGLKMTENNQIFTKDELGKWWCLLNAKKMPEDFPIKGMSQEEAFYWVQAQISHKDALAYWRQYILKKIL